MSETTAIQNVLSPEFLARFADKANTDLTRIGSTGGDTVRLTQNKTFKLPNGIEMAGPLSVVIVDFVFANRYYAGRYNPKDIQPPACFATSESSSDLTPSPNSPSKQADTCAVCQQNVFGSDPGGSGKACKNTVLLAIVPPDGSSEMSVLSVPPTSIGRVKKHLANLAAMKIPPAAVITKVSMDPNETYSSLLFEVEAPNQNFEQAFGLADAARARLMREPETAPVTVSASKARK